MKKKILCLSGWGQKFDSLEFIFNDQAFDPFFVSSLDYSSFGKVEDFFQFVKNNFAQSDAASLQDGAIDDFKNFGNKSNLLLPDKTAAIAENSQPEIVVGWSLGGQLALRLIEKKILRPQLLILIAPPFQLVKDARVAAGMALTTFKKFRDDFANAPDKTLKQFAILTAMNDRNASDIARSLDVNDKNFAQLVFWLDELARFSCFDVDFSNMPQTLYFHGAGDMIVPTLQAQYFKERIANLHQEIFAQCGHAPQLSDVVKMRKIITDKITIDYFY